MYHGSGSSVLPPRGTESPQGPGALYVWSSAAVPAPSTVPNIQPPADKHPPQARLHVGTQGRNTMEKSLPQQGAHFLVVEEAGSKQYKDQVRAVEKTTVRERVSEGRESWVVLVGL